ncbi:MAG: NAD(P)H-dependent oxidoreductase [Chryseolinea sp.]
MNIVIVLAHPRTDSLNVALAQRLMIGLSGHKVILHDLYRDNFDPVLKENEVLDINFFSEDIKPYCESLTAADVLIIVHPNWWGQPPAILKGWIDRVVRLNVGYGFDDRGEGEPVRILKLRHFFVFNTSNTTRDREEHVFHDPLQFIWKNCIGDFLGVDNFHRDTFRIVVTSTSDERERWLSECCRMVIGHLDQ